MSEESEKFLEEFKSHMGDFREKQERFKKLKKGDLSTLPDSDLVTAVMAWMGNKLEGINDWQKEYELIESLPNPCQNVYGCIVTVGEIDNGGFNQYFYNSTSQYIDMAIEGFEALGLKNLGDLLVSAYHTLMENAERLQKYRDGTLESFMESYKEKVFDKLDKTFYQEEAGFNEKIVAYIRENQSVFGD